MYSRKDIIKEFNITFNGLKRIEKESCLHDPNNRKNKKYSYEDYLRIKETIESKYTLPCDCIRIKNSLDYASPKGDIFKESGKTGLYLKAKFNINQGYAYCGINYGGKIITKRVHRIIAETFIPNLENKPQINHIDGNKLNNNCNNLEWCTASENTKHAYNEGLAENKKSFDDSQSIAINQYDLSGKLLNEYGSIREASRECNIPLSTIFNQCKNETYPRKYNFYFRYNNK